MMVFFFLNSIRFWKKQLMQTAGIWKICETKFALTPRPANNESKSQLVYRTLCEAKLKVVQHTKRPQQQIVEIEQNSTLSTKSLTWKRCS